MPELPEVETTRSGIAPHIIGRHIVDVSIRNYALRWSIPIDLPAILQGETVTAVTRRGKYLLLGCTQGTLLIHLGMSGSLRILHPATPFKPHDHLQWRFSEDLAMRLHDPRRFGAVLWLNPGEDRSHSLLAHLGPEPLDNAFDADYLHRISRHRRTCIKTLIMNAQAVVGIGNIYASESLFLAGIRPGKAAKRLHHAECARLVQAIKQVLEQAILEGGTTLRDFVREDGSHGYFRQSLHVYQRAGLPCYHCHSLIKTVRHGQRSSYYCPRCQS